MTIFARMVGLFALALTSSFASLTQASDVAGYPVIPAFEVNTIIRSMGFDPTGAPVRRGPVYVIRAIDDDDIAVRITVDARSGRVLTVTELAANDPYNTPGRFGSVPMPPAQVPAVTYRAAPTDGAPAQPAQPPAAAPPAVRQSAVTPRIPTPRARPPQAKAPESTASIPDTKPGTGKSIPAPVAPSAAPPSSSGSAPAAVEATTKTETVFVPVAPLE
jgi:hypothetical protein